jgi:hypothetical protein
MKTLFYQKFTKKTPSIMRKHLVGEVHLMQPVLKEENLERVKKIFKKYNQEKL